jgi:hypothetical protein
MSVKIYDGMMIARDLTLADARILAGKLRVRLDKVAEQEQTEVCARVAARQVDAAYFGLSDREEPDRSGLGFAMDVLRKERERDKKGERSFLPMGGQMCLFPLGNGRTLAMCFGGKLYRQAFAKLAKAVEYGYWDNTEPEEGLPKGEWAQRGRDWKKALGSNFELSPSEAGLTAEIVSSKYASWWSPEAGQILDALKNEEFGPVERSSRLAKEAMEASWMSVAKPATGGEAHRAMESFNEWRQGEGALPFEALRILYEQELPVLDEVALRCPSGETGLLGAASRARIEAAELARAARPASGSKPKRLAL